jgi:hypothetical protein
MRYNKGSFLYYTSSYGVLSTLFDRRIGNEMPGSMVISNV